FIGSVVLDSKTLAMGLDRGFQYYDKKRTKIQRQATRTLRIGPIPPGARNKMDEKRAGGLRLWESMLLGVVVNQNPESRAPVVQELMQRSASGSARRSQPGRSGMAAISLLV